MRDNEFPVSAFILINKGAKGVTRVAALICNRERFGLGTKLFPEVRRSEKLVGISPVLVYVKFRFFLENNLVICDCVLFVKFGGSYSFYF